MNIIDAIDKSALGPAQNDGAEIIGKYSFDKNFIGFSGHFPGYPILPAVIQLLVAQLLIEQQKGYKIKVISINKAKFLSEIKPDDQMTVKCVDAATSESQRSKVKITSGNKTVSSFSMKYCALKENTKC